MTGLSTWVICLWLLAAFTLVSRATGTEAWEARLVSNHGRGFVASEEAHPIQYFVDRRPWIDREDGHPTLSWRGPGEFGYGEAGSVEVGRVGRVNGLQVFEIQYRWWLSRAEQWAGATPPVPMLARALFGGRSDAELRPFQVIVLSEDEVRGLPASKLVEAGGQVLLQSEIWHSGTGGQETLFLVDLAAGRPVDLHFQAAFFDLWETLAEDGWQAWKPHRFYPEGIGNFLAFDFATLSGFLYLISPERPDGQLVRYSYVHDGDRLRPGSYKPVPQIEVQARAPDPRCSGRDSWIHVPRITDPRAFAQNCLRSMFYPKAVPSESMTSFELDLDHDDKPELWISSKVARGKAGGRHYVFETAGQERYRYVGSINLDPRAVRALDADSEGRPQIATYYRLGTGEGELRRWRLTPAGFEIFETMQVEPSGRDRDLLLGLFGW